MYNWWYEFISNANPAVNVYNVDIVRDISDGIWSRSIDSGVSATAFKLDIVFNNSVCPVIYNGEQYMYIEQYCINPYRINKYEFNYRELPYNRFYLGIKSREAFDIAIEYYLKVTQ